jgi:hypothetical protein
MHVELEPNNINGDQNINQQNFQTAILTLMTQFTQAHQAFMASLASRGPTRTSTDDEVDDEGYQPRRRRRDHD